MGNYRSNLLEGQIDEQEILVSSEELARLETVWGNRRFMSMEEFFDQFIQHPAVPEDLRVLIYKKFCHGSSMLTFKNFVTAITILTKADVPLKNKIFSENQIDIHQLSNLSMTGLEVEQTDYGNENFGHESYKILSGVTHFDEKEIAELQEIFSNLHDLKLLKITETTFVSLLKDFLPCQMVRGLFKAFDEECDGLIDFKEFVCGISALCFGPENARIMFMAQIWWHKDGHFEPSELKSFFDIFLSEDGQNKLVIPITEQSSLIDFVCWTAENRKVVSKLISLSNQIGYLGFGLTPESLRSELEIICEVKNRFQVSDLEEWCILSSDWWSKLIVALNPCCPTSTKVPAVDNTDLIADASLEARGPLSTVDFVILRENLSLKKDYEIVPLFLWNALKTWNAIYEDCPIVRRTLPKSSFVPSQGWPAGWGNETDFSDKYFIELYPPLIQILRHCSSSSDDYKQQEHCLSYSIWRYMSLSRATTIKELHSYFANHLKLDLDGVRLWCLEVDGLKQNRLLLIADDFSSLHSLGILSTAQLLLEVRNRDMSWPEEMQKLKSAGEDNSGWKFTWNNFSEKVYAGTGGVVNFGNTCYMSAALQSLSNIEELSSFFLNNCNTADDRLDENSVSKEYFVFLQDLLVENKSVPPRRLKSIVSQKSSSFCDRLQHDCQEFLQIFLDLLHQDLNTASTETKEKSVGKADDQLDDEQKAQQSWSHHLEVNESIVSQLFTGQVRSSLKCLQCAHLSTTFELFMCVQLPIPMDQLIFVCVNVVQGRETSLRKYAFRIPASTSLSALKDLFTQQTNFSANCLDWLFIDCSGKLEMNVTRKLNDFDILVKDLLTKGIEIYAHVSTSTSSCSTNIITVHRKITYNSTYAIRLTDGTNVTTLGTPFLVNFHRGETTGQQLYAEVLQCVQKFSSENSPSKSSKANRALDANEDTRSGFPFTLSLTSADSMWCSKCDWSKFCRGCVIDCTSSLVLECDEDTCLAVDWKPEPLYLKYSYCTSQMKIEEDDSYLVCSKAQNSALTLDHCFKDFIRPELLDSPSKCDNCEQVAEREKSFSFWRYPPILIVHLKRFVYVPKLGRHIKSHKPVDFPLNNFDLCAYLAGNAIGDDGHSLLYNCVSIVNHHGDLNSGHYTSYVRKKNQWFFFNDSYCRPVKEEYIDKKHSYLIFYQRA